MIVGSRIKEARIKKHLSQQELGDLLGVSKVSICGYETGTRTPTMDMFIKLLDTLDLSPDYVLGRDIDVICEEETTYKKKMSKADIEIINELKKYPNLYNKLCTKANRTVELINKRIG